MTAPDWSQVLTLVLFTNTFVTPQELDSKFAAVYQGINIILVTENEDFFTKWTARPRVKILRGKRLRI